MLSDIEISQNTVLQPIQRVAAKAGIDEDSLELYGKYKAKVSESFIRKVSLNDDGKLILVTAVNPTPAGEGKTTTTIGLGMALEKLGKKTVIALREPSLGPVFGMKGGAAGGGYAQVLPMDEINLHFTGDFHAITASCNLLSAVIDNHIFQGNELDIDPEKVLFSRVTDTNDRALRNITIGQGGEKSGVPRTEHFMITVASEVMAILCLADSLADLKERLGKMLVAYTRDGKPVYCRDLHVNGAMAALMKDAVKPNLVQTVENTPALIHGGPFANIAHGCNSVRATKLAMKLGTYAVTEAGFGADLGAEKFLDIKCRLAGIKPSAVVLVVTVRALKYNGGVAKENLKEENTEALVRGLPNLEAHIENLQKFGVPVVVAVNRFDTDTDKELGIIFDACEKLGADCAESDVFMMGSAGGLVLADKVMKACEKKSDFRFLYSDEMTVKEKIECVAKEIYGAGSVVFSPEAEKSLSDILSIDHAYDRMPVCIAKTQYSLSDDPKKLCRPKDYVFTVRDIKLSAGAGFIVALSGKILTMPGLPKNPAAYSIDVDDDGKITGLF